MRNKYEQQTDIVEDVKSGIEKAEAQRKQLRFNHNLLSLETGNSRVLANEEFLFGLVAFIKSEDDVELEKKKLCLKKMAEFTLSEETALRERILMVFSLVTDWFIEKNEYEVIVILTDFFCSWFEFEDDFLPGYTVIAKRAEEVTKWLLKNAYWQEVEKLVGSMSQIAQGSLPKNNVIRGAISTSLENIALVETIEMLADRFLLEDDNQQVFKNILVSLGENAVAYLVIRIVHSNREKERLSLVNLISAYGDITTPYLSDLLGNKPSVTVLTSIISIISEIGDQTLYERIREKFEHENERVQHEMIRCVLKLGGQEMNKRLIYGLKFVNDSLKINIIKTLSSQGGNDGKILGALCELAEKRQSFSAQLRTEMLEVIIVAFRNFPHKTSVELLKRIKGESALKADSDAIAFQIDETLNLLSPQLRRNSQSIDDSDDIVSFETDPVMKQKALNKTKEIEEQVTRLVKSGDLESATDLVYQQAIVAAREKDYLTAVILGDRILEINPNALVEAIEIGDIIQEQRSGKVTSHQIEIWRELCDEMSLERFQYLFNGMRQVDYQEGDIIVSAKETDSSLYFLGSGQVGISFLSGGSEIFLKKMTPVSVIGGEQFFSASVWTVTLRALSNVSFHVLDQAILMDVEEKFPGFKEILQNYCLKFEEIPSLVKMSGDDRRDFPRYPVSLITQNVLLDPYGKNSKRNFRGELIDLSECGLSFSVRISSDENARLLLGRQILTTISCEEVAFPEVRGTIVGVRNHSIDENYFSVHIKLYKKIAETIVKRIVSLRSAEEPGIDGSV